VVHLLRNPHAAVFPLGQSGRKVQVDGNGVALIDVEYFAVKSGVQFVGGIRVDEGNESYFVRPAEILVLPQREVETEKEIDLEKENEKEIKKEKRRRRRRI